ncbi:hypothetical protein V6N11_012112 [Hibiscus sabdariffa]|uniref:Uncharacterized protein n=1 Tax=Hibiscus sabdariffa TaxID=183260 RepID=A0ABR2QA74_9ROSI
MNSSSICVSKPPTVILMSKLLLKFKTSASWSPENYLSVRRCRQEVDCGTSCTHQSTNTGTVNKLARPPWNGIGSRPAMLGTDILDPNRLSEPEASRDHDTVHNHCSAIEMYGGRSNQHNMVNEGVRDRNGTKDDNMVRDYYRDQYSTIEQDETCNSILTNYDETVTKERSIQHNTVIAGKGFEVLSNLEYLADEDLIPTELPHNDGLYTVLSLDELLAVPEATNNSNWIQNQYITNKEQGSMMASSNSMEKSRKRPHRI